MKRFALAPLVLLPALTLSGCGVTSAPLQIPDAAPASTGAARGGSGSAGTAAPTPAGGVIDAIRRGFAANPAYTATVSSTGNCGGTSAGVRGTETVQRAGGIVRADLKADSPATFDRMIRVGDDAWVRITPGSDYEKATVREVLTDDAVLQGGQTPEEIFERR